MTPPGVRFAHWLLGSAGLGLLRSWLGADRAAVEARGADVERLLRAGTTSRCSPWSLSVPEVDARTGYAAWASTYDVLPNPLIAVEEPVVRGRLAEVPPGRALDAACGTGSYAAFLAERGHRVVGVDGSPAMLAQPRARSPGAPLAVGRFDALSLANASIGVAVCALALTHLPALAPAVAELARVVRSGGRVLVSDFHPTMLLLGGPPSTGPPTAPSAA